MDRKFIVQWVGILGVCLVVGLAGGGALSLLSKGGSSTDEETSSNSDGGLYAPTRTPDRIVLTWTGDPKTTAAVTWRTSKDAAKAIAEIAPAEAGPSFVGKAQSTVPVTTGFETLFAKCNMHTAEFKGLTPGTRYAYRVGDGEHWSEWFQFRTAADKPEPFSFIYLGDSQKDLRTLWSRVVRQAFADAPHAAFILHAGDLSNTAETDSEWGEWFGAGGWIQSSIPVIATPGNHDYTARKKADGSKARKLTPYWVPQFAFPQNGPEGLKETAYYIDYQNLRVIVLNSMERQEEQVPWLERVLSENKSMWTLVMFHHPMFSMSRDRDNAALRELFKPLFDRHHVDLVLTGHDHTYGRTGLVAPATNPAGGAGVSGTVYVVSVSGPKMYPLDKTPDPQMRRVGEEIQLYQIISIDGPVLHYESRTATGDLYDGFTLTKSPGQQNVMTEEKGLMPESRRSGNANRAEEE